MNVLQDPSKKTSINSLLNPQDVSSFSNISSLSSAPLVPNHGHPQVPSYFQQEYPTSSNYHLRTASWDPADSRRKVVPLDQTQVSRYPVHLHEVQHQQMSSIPTPPPFAYESMTRMIRQPTGDSQDYRTSGHLWQPQQHQSSTMPYGPSAVAPMYSEERTALAGDYTPTGISYTSPSDNRPSSTFTDSQTWQSTERASVRLAARGTSTQPLDERYTQSTYYESLRMYESSLEQQPQRQRLDDMAPSQSLESFSSGSSSSKRPLPDEEGNLPPKPKRAKAKTKGTGTESTVPTPSGGSKRGYSQKKRSEAALISAQNDAIQRLQRDACQRQAEDRNPHNELNEGQVISEQYYVPELQNARCMSNRYRNEEFPRCVSCTRRWAGDTCRFQGIRFFLRDPQKKLVAVSFNEHHTMGKSPTMQFPKMWNRSLELEHVLRSKLSIAKALLPVLQGEEQHIQASEIVRRPRECDVRVTCDTCMTSLFSTSFMCRLCGREVCNECFQQVVELTREPQNATPAELAVYTSRREKHAHASPFFLNCTKRIEHGVDEFTPVTRFLREELDQAVLDMQEILKEERVPADRLSDESRKAMVDARTHDSQREPSDEAKSTPPPSLPSHTQMVSNISTSPQTTSVSTNPTDLHQDPLLHPIYDNYTPSNAPEAVTSIPIYRMQIIQASLYDPSRISLSDSSKPPPFSSLWVNGAPLLVKDVLPRFKSNWSPQYFMDRYGDQNCLIVECQTDENKRINIREFFRMFGDYSERKHCWKLKDWPPTAEFKNAFPELFEDFSQAVPVPDYVRRDGVYNLGSHFPTNAIGPDLGPKMYNALASSQDVGSKGSTRLHMDMADALNVMLHATPCEDGTEGYAVWDLFRAEDSDSIRAFLKKRFAFGGLRVGAASINGHTSSSAGGTKKNTSAGPSQAGGGGGCSAGDKAGASHVPAPLIQMIGHDPIHGQQVYLDVQLRKELHDEYGVKSYRVYQRPGDGVFIPAGCAHQVANMADCMKIAIDFVSPENIDRCEKLTKEFREQNQSKVWKEDVLQLRTMMWFAWQSCSKREQELGITAVARPSDSPPAQVQTEKSAPRQ